MRSIIKNLEIRVSRDYGDIPYDGRSTIKIEIPVEGMVLLQITEEDGNVFEADVNFTGTVKGYLISSFGKYFLYPGGKIHCILGSDRPQGVSRDMTQLIDKISLGPDFGEWLNENSGLN